MSFLFCTSGRAEFQHPVPHLMSSLPARSGAVTWTWFRSLRTGHVSWPRFMRRCLLPSPGSLRVVPLVHRYYETLRPPDSLLAALRFLRLAIPWSVCVSSPFGRRRQADGSSRSLLYRLLPIRLTSWNCQDLPCSRETLMTIRPALRPRRDRVRATGPRVNVLDTAPAPKHNEGSPRLQISGLNHTAFGLAVYASKWKLPATAQDSLPAAGPSFAGRDSTRRVSMKGF